MKVVARAMVIMMAVVPISANAHRKPTTSALAQISGANRAATLGPRQGGFVNATEVYPWSEGAIFRLYTSPGRVSDIALEPGEALVSVAAGDTVRWIVGNTASGNGPSKREHILIKPTVSGLSTNLLILTDRRSYHVDVLSTAGNAMASVSWSYPKDNLLSLGPIAPVDPAPMPTDADGGRADLDPTALKFGYTISGETMPWRPVRAFDDGHHVYIEFPVGISAGAAPPLFVTDGKTPELVNYRMRGRFYVVDRLFSHAELRMGDKPQHVVEIVREQGRDAS